MWHLFNGLTENRIRFERILLPLMLALLINGIAYYGVRVYGPVFHPFDFTTSLDRRIPLLSWTVVIYFGAYLFWITNYLLGCMQTPEKAYRFISADFFAKVVCLFCFLLIPTTTVRPAPQDATLWDGMIQWLYHTDAADNLFPSIHCLTSCFSFIAVRDNPQISGWYKLFSFLMAAAVCVSTLTTKQHILMDVFGGIALAEASYSVVATTGFSAIYANCISYINRMIFDTSSDEI